MSNSTHKVEVFKIGEGDLQKHPNADSLNILNVWNYQAVVRIADYKVGDLACYVPPDNVLPDKPEYGFLKGHLRIKAQKLRGVMSQGLVLPAPAGSKPGDDVAAQLGITHYVPKGNSGKGAGNGIRGGMQSTPPPIPGSTYDVDTWFKYGKLIPDGTQVELTEKIHGTNARYTFQAGKMWAGSRNLYRKPPYQHTKWWEKLLAKIHWGKHFLIPHEVPNSVYWDILSLNPWIETICRNHPDHIVYGEIFGWVQDLRYGAKPGEVWFRVFDIFNGKRFLNPSERWEILRESGQDPNQVNAPILYVGPYNKELIEKWISGQTVIPGANHIREGIVIKPMAELWDQRIGRLILKAVSPEYLSKAKELPAEESTVEVEA